MHLRVPKTGFITFDYLHAAGLAISIATVFKCDVNLQDEGVGYILAAETRKKVAWTEDIVRTVLTLPANVNEIKNLAKRTEDIRLANLDGLLAEQFTSIGVRAASVSDLLAIPTMMKDGLKKALALRGRLETWVTACGKESQRKWFEGALEGYAKPLAGSLRPTSYSDGTLAVPMMIDPACGYSFRKPISDGRLSDKSTVAFRKPSSATVFAIIGAARFLRAQRVANHHVNVYIPLIRSIHFTAESRSVRFRSDSNHTSQEARCLQWLSLPSLMVEHGSAQIEGLAYQVLQTQGVQQSISIERGMMDYSWLSNLQSRDLSRITLFWKETFIAERDRVEFDRDLLIESLLHRDGRAWYSHLLDRAVRGWNIARRTYPYTLKQIREITLIMKGGNMEPLQNIMASEIGILRFGRAMRRIKERNRGKILELLDELKEVRTIESLIEFLGEVAKQSELTVDKTKFMRVPDEEDLQVALSQIQQYGPIISASILIALSFVRYPRVTSELESSLPTSGNIQELKNEQSTANTDLRTIDQSSTDLTST